MTREWPAGRPGPEATVGREHATEHATSPAWPCAIVVATALILIIITGALFTFDPGPCMSLVALGVAWVALSLIATGLSRGWRRLGGWISLRRLEDNPRAVAGRLWAMDVPKGRARLCRDVAARCLEGGARFERLEGRLRREEAGWINLMYKEMRRL